MRQLIKMQFGSHVYGTNVPESDMDFKGIFIPDPKDIIMQRACKASINENTKADETKRNTKDDIDFENFSLQGYLKLLAEGQTVALDMLFTPDHFIVKSSDDTGLWDWIKANSNLLISSNSTAFAGYCFKQAAKYGLKGSRLDSLIEIVNVLKQLDPSGHRPLGDFATQLAAFVGKHEHTKIIPMEKKDKTGKVIMNEVYLEVCGRKAGFNATTAQAVAMYQTLYDKYGERAKMAYDNKGVDWKALMHAVRVCHEAIELLTTGKITFPRPEKDLLLQIRKGEVQYSETSELIVQLLAKVTEAEKTSTLRKKPDMKFVDDLVFSVYRDEIYRGT
jgi:RNA repair pathway DNA polymerase beta family protein